MNIALLALLCISIFTGHVTAGAVENVDAYLKRAEQQGFSGSVLVASDGKILLKKGFGSANRAENISFTADTVFDIGSITKQFTAAAILQLEMRGKLSVKDPIGKYFDNAPTDKKRLTIHQLLTHTSGLPDAIGEDEEWITRDEYIKQSFSTPLIHKPGNYAYSNVGYSLLAAIVEKQSGTDYEAYLQKNLFLPAGMKETGYAFPRWNKQRLAVGYRNDKEWGTTYEKSQFEKGVTWHLRGNGGIHSTVGDLYLWHVALQGERILSKAAKDKYFHPHVTEGRPGAFHYGYGWAVTENRRKEKVITHNGGNGFFMATVVMLPQRNGLIVVSCNHMPRNTDTIAFRIDRLVFENQQPLNREFISNFTGYYTLPSGDKFEVKFNENDEAVTVLNDRESWRLLGGGPKDEPDRVKLFDQKTESLLTALARGDASETAKHAGFLSSGSEESVQMKRMVEESCGAIKDFLVLGSVTRGDRYTLTPVILNGSRQTCYRLVIWEGQSVMQMREQPDGNTKNFEYESDNQFYSDTNEMRIHFEMREQQPVAVIIGQGGEVVARKAR